MSQAILAPKSTRALNRQAIVAEAFGTFSLVFAGTGAIIINEVSSGSVTHVGIAITFGLIVMSMIFAIGEISGAHFNPAVTLGFLAFKKISLRLATQYIVAQTIGAFIASSLLLWLFPMNITLGATLPFGSPLQSFILEIMLTLILMFVILSVSHGAKEKGVLAGIAIGGVVGLEAMFAGPISGASMNPARSLAPAVLSGHTEHLWVYLAGPAIGALLAVVIAHIIFQEDFK